MTRDGSTTGRRKVAIVGGGGFRVPIVVEALDRAAAGLGLEEIVLHDVEDARLRRMLLVLEHQRSSATSGPDLRASTDLADAVDDAAAVFVAIRVGGTAGRTIDEEVPLRHGVLGQETVGPGGIAFAIRTIPTMRSIAHVVAANAPSAWFLNFTNPAGTVTQAIRPILGDRVVGICDAPATAMEHVAAALGRRSSDLEFDYAGLNHLGWIVNIGDGQGRDLLPELLADDARLDRIEEVRLLGRERVRALGAIPNEYLVYVERTAEIVATFREGGGRGAAVHDVAERFAITATAEPALAWRAWRDGIDARHATYLAEASPSHPSIGDAPSPSYADVATSFLRSTAQQEPERHVLDVANRGRLGFLEDDDVVEATCEVSSTGVDLLAGRPLPVEAADLVRRVKESERLTIRAATERRADLALEALAAHPVVPSHAAAALILEGYLDRHEGLREFLR